MRIFQLIVKKHRRQKKCAIFHGTFVTIISKDTTVTQSVDTFISNHSSQLNSFKILLASPYVNTFSHETIQLKKKELQKLDTRLFDWMRHVAYDKLIDSIKIGPDLAFTNHSHLSVTGLQLLKRLSSYKRWVRWKPAVSFLLRELTRTPTHFDSNQQLRIYLEQEVLSIHKRVNTLSYEHLPYPDLPENSEQRRILIDDLLEVSKFKGVIHFIKIGAENIVESPSSGLLSKLLFEPKRKSRPAKAITLKKRHRSRQPHGRRIPLTPALVFIVALLVGAAIKLNYDVYLNKRILISKQETLRQLKDSESLFESISREQTAFFEASSLINAIQPLKQNPTEICNVIQKTLPESAWIQRLSISHSDIDIYLLSSIQLEASTLINAFGEQFKKSDLLENREILLGEQPVQSLTFNLRK